MTDSGADTADGVLGAWAGALGAGRSRIGTVAPDRVWEVDAPSGARYILKRVATMPGPDPERRFVAEARVLGFLAGRGVPVAPPVPADDGRIFTAVGGGADGDGDAEVRRYGLFPRLDAGAATADDGLGAESARLLRNLGAALARLHLALADCPFTVDSWEIGPHVHDAVHPRLAAELPAALHADLAAALDPHRAAMARALAAPRQRIHGDAHGGNLLTAGTAVTGIVDVDHLPLAPRGYDLAYHLAFGVHNHLTGQHVPESRRRPVERTAPFKARHLLAGYHAVAPLSAREDADLPALALVTAVGLVDWFRSDPAVAEEWVRVAAWIGGHPECFRMAA